jgi:hypothetical protein
MTRPQSGVAGGRAHRVLSNRFLSDYFWLELEKSGE